MNQEFRAADIAQTLSETSKPSADSAPQRPKRPRRSFRQFPVDALPSPIARIVQSVAGATGTDPSWPALAALTVIAGCVGNRVGVLLKRGWVEPAILWAALVGKSGSTKSVVLRLVTRPLVELFKEERDEFAKEMNDYFAQQGRYEVALSQWKNQQKTGPPTDPPIEPEKPKEKRVLTSDVTIEKLAALLGDNPLGLLLVRDELAGLVNSFDRYAGGKGSDLQSWLSMNDGGSLIVDRKTAGSTFVERASVSLLGTIQPYTLANVFGVTEREAGLLARMLLAYPPHRPALWTDEELPDDVVAEWRDMLASLLAIEPARDDGNRPKPRVIGLSYDAKAKFISWHDQHAREVADLGDDHLRAHWSKPKGTCARIALLFACTEVVGGKSVSSVSLEGIVRAIQVTEWLKYESARIYGTLTESNEDRDRRELIEWIEGRSGRATVHDLTHKLWQFRNKANAAQAALDALAKDGIGRWVHPAPGPKGGRPSAQFELTVLDNITITKTRSEDAVNAGFGDGDAPRQDENEPSGDLGMSQ